MLINTLIPLFCRAVMLYPGGKKRSIPFRRQRMQIDELIPSSSQTAYPVPQPDDPYIADLLQLADGRFLLKLFLLFAVVCW